MEYLAPIFATMIGVGILLPGIVRRLKKNGKPQGGCAGCAGCPNSSNVTNACVPSVQLEKK